MTSVIRMLYKILFTPLRFVSEALAARNNSCRFRQVFIIGPPRSGTTLLSQFLINNYPFFYIYNLLYKTYPAMYLFQLMWSFLPKNIKKNKNILDSYYGDTKGIFGAHEGGNFWNQWFKPADTHFAGKDYAIRNEKSLVDTVNGLSNISKKHFLVKNLPCGMRLQVLTRLFPNALFLVCERDDVATGKSILNGRIIYHGNINSWFGISPKNKPQIMQLETPHLQIAQQVLSIKKQIDLDLMGFEKNVQRVSYEELCNNTDVAIKKLNDFFNEHQLFNHMKLTEFDKSGIKASKFHILDRNDMLLNDAFSTLKNTYSDE